MQHTCLCERYVYASCLCINRIWDRFKSESETDSSQEQTQLVQHTLTCSECIVAARKTTARQCHLEPCITCVITCWRGEHIHKNVCENHSWMWWGGLVRLQRHQECYNLLELKRIHSHSGIAVNLLKLCTHYMWVYATKEGMKRSGTQPCWKDHQNNLATWSVACWKDNQNKEWCTPFLCRMNGAMRWQIAVICKLLDHKSRY